uniref:Uncharacterized protein n=1 Tax=Trypanosoma vivax (strain Y486) TaxID=1055687 RepID=G0TZ08_TRYVY|nr:hypothetical protein, unlikely [Trypanosoma vivax Y486]
MRRKGRGNLLKQEVRPCWAHCGQVGHTQIPHPPITKNERNTAKRKKVCKESKRKLKAVQRESELEIILSRKEINKLLCFAEAKPGRYTAVHDRCNHQQQSKCYCYYSPSRSSTTPRGQCKNKKSTLHRTNADMCCI